MLFELCSNYIIGKVAFAVQLLNSQHALRSLLYLYIFKLFISKTFNNSDSISDIISFFYIYLYLIYYFLIFHDLGYFYI